MPRCVISNCKSPNISSSQRKGHISYHSFPNDPLIQEKWIAATGRKDWFPTKHSTICSIHFDNTSFIEGKKLRLLKKTAYPTIDILKLIDNDDENKNTPQESSSLSRKRKLEKDVNELLTTKGKRETEDELLNTSNNAREKKYTKNKIKKRLREQNQRKVNKIISLMTLLNCLKQKSLINEEQAYILQWTNVTTRELYSKQQKNKNKISTSKYSPALRTFALTLYFYSSKAYIYARKVFNVCLPHPHTIYKWFKCINGSPGFTTESLNALKCIASKSKKPLYCCLMIDEMAIGRIIEWDGERLYGYEDFGGNLDTDQVPEAKEALVMLLTGINASWKVPIGYFLIDGANSDQKAALVLQCLRHLAESYITVVGLTFDGCPTNIAMAKLLGCKFDPNDMKSTFEHPVTLQPIAIFPDAWHMMKLIRYCLQEYGTIIDSNGKSISWDYFDLLHKLQTTDFHLASKLRVQHIYFHIQKLKDELATQLFNKRVADSLDCCREHLRILHFKDSLATTEFIRIFNNLFDVLNSRNLNNFDFKQPLNLRNKKTVMFFLEKAEEYIKGLRTLEGDLLTNSGRKTGFIGLLVCIKSTKALYQHLIEEDRINFLSMNRFSQEHLELFFYNVRAHSGSNHDPTARQFQSFYKEILSHVEIKNSNTGNFVELEKISILSCSSAIQTINATTQGSLDDDTDFRELNKSSVRDIYDFCKTLPQMTEFCDQVITYIAGYVVRTIQKQIKCDECNSALVLQKPEIDLTYELVIFKDKGGRVYPSEDVIQICKVAELEIRAIINKPQKFNIIPSKNNPLHKILRNFVNSKIFNSIAVHQFDQSPTENHLVNLIKVVASIYMDVRFYYLSK